LSDHLYDVFSNWRKSFAGVTSDFEMLYERFEVTGSLAHLSSTSQTDLKSKLENSSNQNIIGYQRMPIGRTQWNIETKDRLFQQLRSKERRRTLVNSGLAESENYIDLFMINFDNVVNYLPCRSPMNF
jgi:hypothetical protein